MAQTVVLAGANIKIFLNGTLYREAQSMQFTIDYGEYSIYGIDSPYPQEIAPGRNTVTGSISGIRMKMSGGLQSYGARPVWSDFAASPYISIRIQDRATSEDILYVESAKITNEKHNAATKGVYKLSFDFIGQIGLTSVDRID